jgi:hypothetical protein
MARSTSAVAVCCWSDSLKSSVRSRNSEKQPRVLDGDDRLRREILQQTDFFIRKRPHFLSEDHNPAMQRIIGP